MRLPKFTYSDPESLAEASSILSDDPAARILAGGTDLVVNMKHGVERPGRVVNIKKIPGLNLIQRDNGALRIGALARLKEVYRHPELNGTIKALTDAASSVGSCHHQVMGTIGGNLCQQNRCKYFNQSKAWRSSRALCFKAGGKICHVTNREGSCHSTYCGDMAPSLLVLEATAVLESGKVKREVSLEQIFSGDGKAPLQINPGEIMTGFVIPKESFQGTSVYVKFANRKSIDFPIVGAALWASLDGKEYRVAFTGVDRMPVRAHALERKLAGTELKGGVITDLEDIVSGSAHPVKTSVYSPSFKRKMMTALLEQAVNIITGR